MNEGQEGEGGAHLFARGANGAAEAHHVRAEGSDLHGMQQLKAEVLGDKRAMGFGLVVVSRRLPPSFFKGLVLKGNQKENQMPCFSQQLKALGSQPR